MFKKLCVQILGNLVWFLAASVETPNCKYHDSTSQLSSLRCTRLIQHLQREIWREGRNGKERGGMGRVCAEKHRDGYLSHWDVIVDTDGEVLGIGDHTLEREAMEAWGSDLGSSHRSPWSRVSTISLGALTRPSAVAIDVFIWPAISRKEPKPLKNETNQRKN
jgi:hypothetical protein